MRHVDDGALHAWLDEELGVYPIDEARWIREHLAACGACAERLEDARALRGEVEAVLSGADVELEHLPSLEELQAEARGASLGNAPDGGAGEPAPGSQGRRRSARLAWAASIVLAAGAGWIANALLPPGSPSGLPYLGPSEVGAPAERQYAEPEPVALPGRGDGEEAARGAGAPAAEGGGAEAEPAARTTPLAEAESPPVDPSADRQRAGNWSEEVVAAPEAEPAGLASEVAKATPPVSDTGVTLPGSLVSELSDVAEVRRVAPAAPEAEPTAEEEGAVAQGDFAATIPEGVIPGLPILSVEPVPAPGPGLRVRQRMESGEVLEVYLLPDSASPDELPDPEDGVNQWVEPRGDGWRVLRGRIPVEVLRALAEGG